VARIHLEDQKQRLKSEILELLSLQEQDEEAAEAYWELISGKRALVEQASSLSEVEARMLGSGDYPDLVRPIWVLVRRHGADFEVEVLGFPILYASASALDESLELLVELMVGFAADLERFDSLGEAAKSLEGFLKSVLRG
jgi:hypothetical protein